MNENPNDGGSYSRDPETGELRLLEPTTRPPLGKSGNAAATEEATPIPASLSGLIRRRYSPEQVAPSDESNRTDTTATDSEE